MLKTPGPAIIFLSILFLSACEGPVDPDDGPVLFASVSAGASHTCALTVEGRARCWGSNHSGELGTGDTIPHDGPVQAAPSAEFRSISAGDRATCGITVDNEILCWGNAGTAGPEIMAMGSLEQWSSISVGYYFPLLCAASANKVLKCGSGPTPFGFESPLPGVYLAKVSTGGYFGVISYGESGRGPGPVGYWCGLTADGQAYCGFDDQYGQRGDGSGITSASASAVAGNLRFADISADAIEGNHVCGVASDGTAYCWGGNEHGELGAQTSEFCEPLGLSGSAEGFPCSSSPIAVNSALGFTSINVGGGFTCGITAADQSLALCWGANGSGQLGDGTTQASNVPEVVSGGHQFTGISAGTAHACGVTALGEVRCWGENSSGQLGDGTFTDRQIPVLITSAAAI